MRAVNVLGTQYMVEELSVAECPRLEVCDIFVIGPQRKLWLKEKLKELRKIWSAT